MGKAQIIKRMLEFEQRLIGTNYSQPYRLNIYKGGSCDCSSLQAAAMSYAGFPLLTAGGAELLVSNSEVYAAGYDLIYPSSQSMIGQNLPSPSSVVGLMQQGDLVFYNFNSTTPRANKITHIGAVRDGSTLIQTCNNTIKLATYPITWGATHVCAIIRLKPGVERLTLPTIRIGSGPRYAVRILQAVLNHNGASLLWEGNFGPKTEAALKALQTKAGRAADGVVDTEEWKWLLGEEAAVVTPPTVLKYGMSGPAVQEAQLLLNKHLGPMLDGTGKFLDKTVAAVKWFQRIKGFEQNGIIDDKVLAALKLAPVFPILRNGSISQHVCLMKYWANKKGATLNVDNPNYLGDTETWVKGFQKAQSIGIDGVCGEVTWKRLLS